jgi:hypothetical protein
MGGERRKMSETIRQRIHAGMMRYSKEQLIAMIEHAEAAQYERCVEAGVLRKSMASMARLLNRFGDIADELDTQSHDALQVGGYVPTIEEWATATVPTKLLYDARELAATPPKEIVAKFSAEMDAARLCIEALKELEQQGIALAAQTLAKVRQVDPHI